LLYKKLYKKLHKKLQTKLQKKVHPCLLQNSAAPPLVLLPGWGFDSCLWQDLIKPLQRFTQVITLDLPGFGDNHLVPWRDQEDLCRQIVRTMPPQALYAGWSLGGMLATKIAATFPDRTVGIITLATNASFIARRGWPHAMSAANFQNFYTTVEKDPEHALKRFRLLISQGDQLDRRQLRWLRTVATPPADYHCLLPALSLLKEIDNSKDINRLQVPGLHIFGEQDHLVPLLAAQTLAGLSIQHKNDRQQIYWLKNTGHLVFWPNERVVSLIKNFLTTFQHHAN
jgi:pimeloyl-ACP methyl ester esterase